MTISPPVTVDQPVDQARDPVLSDDGGRTHLVYAVAGESGLALAGVTW